MVSIGELVMHLNIVLSRLMTLYVLTFYEKLHFSHKKLRCRRNTLGENKPDFSEQFRQFLKNDILKLFFSRI